MYSSKEILHNALKECMQKELEAVPSDREIKKIYTPSSSFKKYINRLIKREKLKDKFKIVYEHKRAIYQLAAGAALFMLAVYIGNVFTSPKTSDNSSVEKSVQVETTTETADRATAETADMVATESVEESTTNATTDATMQAGSITEAVWTAEVTGKNEALLKMKNNTEQAVSYANISKVEKYENGSWITIYESSQVEVNILNSGELKEETIKLSDYGITENGSYKLYRDINKETTTVDMEFIQP